MTTWELPLGTTMTRAERRAQFGGATMGGIQPSGRTPNVFLYMDPSVSTSHGYDYDGWVDDSLLQYTGEGRLGEQRMVRNNKALLSHVQDQRAIRFFSVDGTKPNSQEKLHQYIGEFRIDDEQPFLRAEALDDEGELRTVVVFRLRPVGEVLRRSQDECHSPPLGISVAIEDVGLIRTEDIEVEGVHSPIYELAPGETTVGRRREAELVWRYKEHLEAEHHVVTAKAIHTSGSSRPQRVDLFDRTTGDLCEAKSSANRWAVRLALGQIADYRRHVEHSSCSALFPARPAPDLVELLHGSGIDVVFETDQGDFVRLRHR